MYVCVKYNKNMDTGIFRLFHYCRAVEQLSVKLRPQRSVLSFVFVLKLWEFHVTKSNVIVTRTITSAEQQQKQLNLTDESFWFVPFNENLTNSKTRDQQYTQT